MKYRSTKAGPGERVVHNFPANGRAFGVDGFRYWTEVIAEVEEDGRVGERMRCHCDWTERVPEHYGTVFVITEAGGRKERAT
jgi:hypothetical protein